MIKKRFWVSAVCLLGCAGAAMAAKPQRIVSLNMCADQYLLALADRQQIAGLTRFAGDPDMSAAAAQTKGLRLLGQSAEEILAVRPDLLVGMPAKRHTTVQALRSQNYPTLDVQQANNLSTIYAELVHVAAAIGHPARGTALVADMQRELAHIRPNGKNRVAAYYQRRGYLTGTGTLIDDMMQRVGLVNLATQLKRPVISNLSLEELIAAKPDFIIIEADSDTIKDQGTEMLHHPALRHIPRLRLPQAWTVCGSPAYVKAMHSLTGQIERHDRP